MAAGNTRKGRPNPGAEKIKNQNDRQPFRLTKKPVFCAPQQAAKSKICKIGFQLV
jgi:hypothetical protein